MKLVKWDQKKVHNQKCLIQIGWQTTYSLECESHNADCRKSIRRIDPFELLYASMLQWVGWNSADVITSAMRHGIS